ncbi:MAG: membrane or secreted protein [Schleiferiaceae bacterium]|nr:membrane or secreted protein [Schleiferiaceae bacterium]
MIVSLKLILVAVVLLGLGLLGMAVKIWAKKDGEFAGTCASNSPFLNKDGDACSLCGALPEQQCQKEGAEE